MLNIASEARMRRDFLLGSGLALGRLGGFWQTALQLTGG